MPCKYYNLSVFHAKSVEEIWFSTANLYRDRLTSYRASNTAPFPRARYFFREKFGSTVSRRRKSRGDATPAASSPDSKEHIQGLSPKRWIWDYAQIEVMLISPSCVIEAQNQRSRVRVDDWQMACTLVSVDDPIYHLQSWSNLRIRDVCVK